MNRPTPNPSQEGNRHRSASCPFPSWEGLAVGSWSQCMRKSERSLSMNRVQKREHPSSVAVLLRRVEAPRTPNAAAHWPSASDFAKRLECVRLAGAFHGSWSQCLRKSERRLSMNRPTPDPSQEGNRHRSASCPFPSWEGLGGGFMVPMHAQKRKEALHEPQCRAGVHAPQYCYGARVLSASVRKYQFSTQHPCR